MVREEGIKEKYEYEVNINLIPISSSLSEETSSS